LEEFLTVDDKDRYSRAYFVLHELTGMNAKKNPEIGDLADNVLVAIEQEKNINQDIHDLKGKVSSNVGKVIEEIINENIDVNLKFLQVVGELSEDEIDCTNIN